MIPKFVIILIFSTLATQAFPSNSGGNNNPQPNANTGGIGIRYLNVSLTNNGSQQVQGYRSNNGSTTKSSSKPVLLVGYNNPPKNASKPTAPVSYHKPTSNASKPSPPIGYNNVTNGGLKPSVSVNHSNVTKNGTRPYLPVHQGNSTNNASRSTSSTQQGNSYKKNRRSLRSVFDTYGSKNGTVGSGQGSRTGPTRSVHQNHNNTNVVKPALAVRRSNSSFHNGSQHYWHVNKPSGAERNSATAGQ